jgi:signal transduction histidine kinase
MEDIDQPRNLIERLFWLIKLRWIAVAGVIFTVFFASQIIDFSLPIFPLYAVAGTLGIYNLAFLLLLVRIKKKESPRLVSIAERIANLQISFDLICLSILIHYSGGIENPFIFYFIFHMIIAGILLTRRASYLQATFAVALFALFVTLEYTGITPHYCLRQFMHHDQHNNPVYILGISFVFISTLYIAVYMASSIAAKLRQREAALAQANAVLKENDRVKSEYVLRVSHDIKEHLAAIQGTLEPVAARITGELNYKQLDLVQRAVRRTAKLVFFVKALLEITRIKLSKELKTSYFSFKELLYEAVSFIASKAKDKGITVNSNIEDSIDRIRGAREYIQEAIVNILANAVKYTPRNGKIDIFVKNKGSVILIRIIDTGIGIPGGELPRIFDEFYRASNAKVVERDGTGLGLSIVKHIVQMHKGKIWVESEEGKGSTFNIELPK